MAILLETQLPSDHFVGVSPARVVEDSASASTPRAYKAVLCPCLQEYHDTEKDKFGCADIKAKNDGVGEKLVWSSRCRRDRKEQVSLGHDQG